MRLWPFPSQLELIAAHEAGHAVVAVAFGEPFHSVDIVPRDGSCGQILLYLDFLCPPEGLPRWQFEQRIQIKTAGEYAGLYAVAELYGWRKAARCSGHVQDIEMAEGTAGRMWVDGAKRSQRLAEAQNAARMALRHYRPALKAVRDNLLTHRRLTREGVLQAFRDAMPHHRGQWRLNRRRYFALPTG